MGFIYPRNCVYKFIFNENYSNDTNIIQYFIMHGLILCIRLNIFVAHIIYAWSFGHNTSVTTSIKKNKYFLSLNECTTVFAWVDVNKNKNIS